MIRGHIDEDLQAIVPLDVLHKTKTETIEFLVDTGFTGFLALPPPLVRKLGLSVIDIQRGMTADGRVGYFETVDVCILWHDQPKVLRAPVLDEPLIGTRLLKSH
jgi:clan AA aspartic protease